MYVQQIGAASVVVLPDERRAWITAPRRRGVLAWRDTIGRAELEARRNGLPAHAKAHTYAAGDDCPGGYVVEYEWRTTAKPARRSVRRVPRIR